jgi:molybdopterin/thiamine biosynthesis adenylyltransferase
LSGASEQPWWEQDPDRLEKERAAITAIAPIKAENTDGGIYRAITELRFEGKPIEIRVEFSPEHPFVPPLLYGQPGLIERHQNPLGGNFCLVGNIEHWWRPHYTAGDLLQILQELLKATEDGTVSDGEYPIPEPITGHITTRADLVVLIPDCMLDEKLTGEGQFELAQSRPQIWVVTKVEIGEDKWELEGFLRARFGLDGGVPTRKGQWAALEDRPSAHETHLLGEKALELMRQHAPRRSGGRERWSAVSYLEEGPLLDQTRRAWLFYEARAGVRGGINDPGGPIATQALDQAIRAERIPELVGLSECRFLVVGAGTLGSAILGELAKADAGRIDVIDHDFYDVNNSVRHVLSITDAGLSKATAVANWGNLLSPFTEVVAHEVKLASRPDSRPLLNDLVREATVVIEAVGDHNLTRLLHRRCSDHGVPLVTTAMTPGGYGGRVVVLRDPSPCFDCYRADQDIIRPERGPDNLATPYGCSHPAASAAGFDATELAAIAARTAVQVSGATGYPALDFQWATVNFRGKPRWSQGYLSLNLECEWCR